MTTHFKPAFINATVGSGLALTCADAAKQSNRIGISPVRNVYVFDLLKATNNKAKTP